MTLAPPDLGSARVTGYPLSGTRLPDVQPFSLRAATSWQRELETIRVWIPETLIPYLTDTFGSLTDGQTNAINQLAVDVNTALDAQTATVNAALSAEQADIQSQAAAAVAASAQALLASADASTDPAIMAVINNMSSQTRTFLDGHYVKSDAQSTDAAVLPAFQRSGSLIAAFTDGRYLRTDATSEDGAVLAGLQKAASLSLGFLDLRHLKSDTPTVDAAILAALQRSGSQSLQFLDPRYASNFSDSSLNSLLQNLASLSRITLNGAFVQSDASHIDPAILAGLQLASSTSLAYLDGRFQKSGATNLDPAILAGLQVASSASLAYLDARFRRQVTLTGDDWMTASARAALVAGNLQVGYLVHETDTGKSYKWMGSTPGWVLWDSGDPGWTNIPYASGFSNGSAGSQDSLSWIVRNGTMHIRGIATGTIASGTSATVSGTWTAPHAKYLPGTGKSRIFAAGAGSAGRFADAIIDATGAIALIWNNGGTAYTAPTYYTVNMSLPYGSDS